jgi:hypothetical protein
MRASVEFAVHSMNTDSVASAAHERQWARKRMKVPFDEEDDGDEEEGGGTDADDDDDDDDEEEEEEEEAAPEEKKEEGLEEERCEVCFEIDVDEADTGAQSNAFVSCVALLFC